MIAALNQWSFWIALGIGFLIGSLVVGVSLGRQIFVLKYCYINLSDWTARKLESILETSRYMVEQMRDDIPRDQIDDWISFDITKASEEWKKEVQEDFKTMRRNGISPPTERHLAAPILRWFK